MARARLQQLQLQLLDKLTTASITLSTMATRQAMAKQRWISTTDKQQRLNSSTMERLLLKAMVVTRQAAPRHTPRTITISNTTITTTDSSNSNRLRPMGKHREPVANQWRVVSRAIMKRQVTISSQVLEAKRATKIEKTKLEYEEMHAYVVG